MVAAVLTPAERRLAFLEQRSALIVASHKLYVADGMAAPIIFAMSLLDPVGRALAVEWIGEESVVRALADDPDPVYFRAMPYATVATNGARGLVTTFPHLAAVLTCQPTDGTVVAVGFVHGGAAALVL